MEPEFHSQCFEAFISEDKAVAFRNLSEAAKNDRNFMLDAVNRQGCLLQFASDELRNDEKIVLAAVKQVGCALKYASEALKNNKRVVTAAVSSMCCGETFFYASPALRKDRDFVLSVVKIDGFALEGASQDFQNDREILLAAMNQSEDVYDILDEKMKSNPEIIQACVKNGGFYVLSELLRSQRDIALMAIKACCSDLEYVGGNLKNEFFVVSTAVKQSPRVFRYASTTMQVYFDSLFLVWKTWRKLQVKGGFVHRWLPLEVVEAVFALVVVV